MAELRGIPRWYTDPLPHATLRFPGVSCGHRGALDITFMGDAYTTRMCNACGARWHQRKGMTLWVTTTGR